MNDSVDPVSGDPADAYDLAFPRLFDIILDFGATDLCLIDVRFPLARTSF